MSSVGILSTMSEGSPLYRKKRAELIELVDLLIKSSGETDFESVASLLAISCDENVFVQSNLMPPNLSMDSAPDVLSNERKGSSSVLAIWLLLYLTHPNGVMKIIDKRICYRKVLKTSLFQAPRNKCSALIDPLPLVVAPAPVNSDAVVSILEVVVKFNGTCITLEPLHKILQHLSEQSSGPNDKSGALEEEKAAALSRLIPVRLVKLSPPLITESTTPCGELPL